MNGCNAADCWKHPAKTPPCRTISRLRPHIEDPHFFYLLEKYIKTGSGGREYTMTSIGREHFSALCNTLAYHTQRDDTEEMLREDYVRGLKLGLVRFVAQTPMVENIVISYRGRTNPVAVKDRWHHRVFHLNLNGHFHGQETWRRLGGTRSRVQCIPLFGIDTEGATTGLAVWNVVRMLYRFSVCFHAVRVFDPTWIDILFRFPLETTYVCMSWPDMEVRISWK